MSWRSSGTFIALPLFLVACGDKSASDPRTEAPLVQTTLVQAASSNAPSFTGIIGARVQSDLGFRVQGKVLQRLVDVGQVVQRGQPLMRMDPVDLGLEAHARSADVAAVRARAKQAIDDEARYRDLVADGAVSASAYDSMKAAADAAKAQLNAAEAQYGVAKNATGYAVLLADADGVIVETLAEPGQVVTAGQVVVRLAHAGPREAVVQLPETVRPQLGSRARATLYGEAQASGGATLRQLSDAADHVTRTYEAKYVLDGRLAAAPLGSTVTVRLDDGAAAPGSQLQVPSGAVIDSGQGSGVWAVAGSPAKVTWRSVQVRGVADDAVRIDGAVKAGERIVALGAHLLHEGETVRLDGAAPARAPAKGQAVAVADTGAKR